MMGIGNCFATPSRKCAGGPDGRSSGWVLMENHYHAVFRTPEPNLVAGMQWIQNAFTRRLNVRREL